MASPGDETAAGAERHARLRASAADREQAIEALKAAFVQDRITKDELDQRIGKALASRTYDDLDVLTADMPAQTAASRARTRISSRKKTDPARERRGRGHGLRDDRSGAGGASALPGFRSGRPGRRIRDRRVRGRAASGAPDANQMGP